MLFFKEIVDRKFEDPEFKAFFDKECHICSVTMKIVSKIESGKTSLAEVIGSSEDLKRSYEDLKNGDYCDPELVRKLYAFLGEEEPESFQNCPRRK